MDTSSSAQQEGYVESPVQASAQPTQDDCSVISPTLADILSDDRILRFYQCVKDIKTQNSPKQTAAMFFALCHALGDTVSFLKVPNIAKIMVRQEQQIFAVNVSGTQQDTVQMFQTTNSTTSQAAPQPTVQLEAIAGNTTELMHDVDSTHTSNLFSAAADSSPQHLLQAALASVASHVENSQQLAPAPANAIITPTKRKLLENKDGAPKRTKKASPRDKEYVVRRNEIIQDLLKVSEADLVHQANVVDSDTKLVIQGHERSTKLGMLPPLQRFSALANLVAHYDCDFSPKNAGIYYNFEYFQLYLAYRDLETEHQQQLQLQGAGPDTKPVLVRVRNDIEKVLVNTNWEAIRRRLTIGERICQVCGVVGRGFLLLSKQISGRKLLHNFNAGEWGEFMREFKKPENQPLLQTLQTKYSPERLYDPHQDVMVATSSNQTDQNNNTIVENMMKPELVHQQESHTPDTTTSINTDYNTPMSASTPVVPPATAVENINNTNNETSINDPAASNDTDTPTNSTDHLNQVTTHIEHHDDESVAAVAAAVAAVVHSSTPTTPSSTTAASELKQD